jgi:hypothetical protein
MRTRPVKPVFFVAIAAAALLLTPTPRVFAEQLPTAPKKDAPPAKPAAQVKVELVLSRLEEEAAPAAPVTPTAPATPAQTPVVLGTPTLITLDRNTATVAVTATDMSYNVSLSPTVESANNSVQVLWNVRLTGKNLGGATAVSASGATRLGTGKDLPLTEISVTDGATGKKTTFAIRAKITVGAVEAPATVTVPAATTAPAAPAAPGTTPATP